MARRSRQDAADWLRILTAGIPPRALARLAALSLHAGEILARSDAELEERVGLTPRDLARLRRPPDARRIGDALARWENTGMRLVTLGEPGYPSRLLQCPIPPACLFVLGELRPEDDLAVAIVGPRAPSPQGLDMTGRLVAELAATLTVVSGGAVGIDARAHEATLEAGGRTLIVAGCGLDNDYPASNAALRRRVLDHGAGAVISPFVPGTPPRPANFPARNGVLAGLCLATIVVEATSHSGALSTARAAMDLGRHVYAVPGDPTRETSTGTNELLRDGAGVCTRAADVLADLEPVLHGELGRLRARELRPVPLPATAPPSTPPMSTPTGPPAPPILDDLAPAERAVLTHLARHGRTLHDDLIAALVPAVTSIGELSTALLMLELNGLVAQHPGRQYEARRQ